jgi:general secretion pathway protein A
MNPTTQELDAPRLALLIDESSVLRLEVFMELHTLPQFQADSKPMLPMIFAGQNDLRDKLLYRTSLSLSSRVGSRSHLEGVNRQEVEFYLKPRLKIAGVKQPLFSAQAITAIHQSSGGLFRRANQLARGALIAAVFRGYAKPFLLGTRRRWGNCAFIDGRT